MAYTSHAELLTSAAVYVVPTDAREYQQNWRLLTAQLNVLSDIVLKTSRYRFSVRWISRGGS